MSPSEFVGVELTSALARLAASSMRTELRLPLLDSRQGSTRDQQSTEVCWCDTSTVVGSRFA